MKRKRNKLTRRNTREQRVNFNKTNELYMVVINMFTLKAEEKENQTSGGEETQAVNLNN